MKASLVLVFFVYSSFLFKKENRNAAYQYTECVNVSKFLLTPKSL